MSGRAAIAGLAWLGVLALPNASGSWAGLPAGDVTLWWRLCAVHAAVALTLGLFAGSWRRALFIGLAVCLPGWAHLSGFPPLLAPLACLPLALAMLRAPGPWHILALTSLAGAVWLLGAAGWIFHYFAEPWLPSLMALALACLLFAPVSALCAALLRRHAAWLPLAALGWPATEWVRASWANPPLPGLTLSHAAGQSALAHLVPWVGEFGLAASVSALCWGGALAWERLGPRARHSLPALALALVAAAGAVAPEAARTSGGPLRVCAIKDPHRLERGAEAFDAGGASAINGLAARAERVHGCAISVLPEYSLEVDAGRLASREVASRRAQGAHLSGARSAHLVGGAYSRTRDARGRPDQLRNLACLLVPDGAAHYLCADPRDKTVFAPFGEAAFFQDLAWLRPLGRWISLRATGNRYRQLTSVDDQGPLTAGSHRIGSALCWEILVPGIFERRGIAPGTASLLVVPSDLNGFGGSLEAIEQFRRAARLHALRQDTPILFASTHAPFLIDRHGRALSPVVDETFFAVWELELPR